MTITERHQVQLQLCVSVIRIQRLAIKSVLSGALVNDWLVPWLRAVDRDLEWVTTKLEEIKHS